MHENQEMWDSNLLLCQAKQRNQISFETSLGRRRHVFCDSPAKMKTSRRLLPPHQIPTYDVRFLEDADCGPSNETDMLTIDNYRSQTVDKTHPKTVAAHVSMRSGRSRDSSFDFVARHFDSSACIKGLALSTDLSFLLGCEGVPVHVPLTPTPPSLCTVCFVLDVRQLLAFSSYQRTMHRRLAKASDGCRKEPEED